MSKELDGATHYNEGGLTLSGTVMLGAGVMIGPVIFALTYQMVPILGYD